MEPPSTNKVSLTRKPRPPPGRNKMQDFRREYDNRYDKKESAGCPAGTNPIEENK